MTRKLTGFFLYIIVLSVFILCAAEPSGDNNPDINSITIALKKKINERNSYLPFCPLEGMDGKSLFELCVKGSDKCPEAMSKVLAQIKLSGDRYIKKAEKCLVKMQKVAASQGRADRLSLIAKTWHELGGVRAKSVKKKKIKPPVALPRSELGAPVSSPVPVKRKADLLSPRHVLEATASSRVPVEREAAKDSKPLSPHYRILSPVSFLGCPSEDRSFSPIGFFDFSDDDLFGDETS